RVSSCILDRNIINGILNTIQKTKIVFFRRIIPRNAINRDATLFSLKDFSKRNPELIFICRSDLLFLQTVEDDHIMVTSYVCKKICIKLILIDHVQCVAPSLPGEQCTIGLGNPYSTTV